MQLLRLTLTDFRSYPALRFTPKNRLNVFTGANGSGKTNLLEAISLLVPGRGLRGARFSELARQGRESSGSWAVAAKFTGFELGTGTAEGAPERRVFQLDGIKPRAQAEIAQKLAAVWLTPQMDRLFTDPAGGRRKFLDRLVIALEPGHARELAAFEAGSAQRNRLLAEPNADPLWLDGLEDAMARHATAATAARATLVAQLNATLASGAADPFARVRLALDCPLAARLREQPALAVEDGLRAGYKISRAQDAARGAAGAGPHKTDFLLHTEAGQPASLASTGQQKTMILGVILAHAVLIATLREAPPLLLLDEPLVHLDAPHRQALLEALARLDLTAWLTGTDAEAFAGFAADYYVIRDRTIAGA